MAQVYPFPATKRRGLIATAASTGNRFGSNRDGATRYLEQIVRKHHDALVRYGVEQPMIIAETDALRRHLLFHAGLLEVGTVPRSAS